MMHKSIINSFLLVFFLLQTSPGCNSTNASEKGKVTSNETDNIDLKNKNQIKNITCKLSTYKKDISAPYFGFNNNSANSPSWSDKKFIAVLQNLQPQFLRFPGGTVSGFWNWREGSLDVNAPEKFDNNQDVSNKFKATLDSFKNSIDSTKATPIFVLNQLNSTLQDQLDMLKYAKKIHLEVSYIEMGNEYYLDREYYNKKYTSGTVYAMEAIKWVQEIKKEFPNAKFALCCSRPGTDKDAKSITWNKEIFDAIKTNSDIEAITVHPYAGPGSGIKEFKGQMTLDNMANVLAASFNGEKLSDFPNLPKGKKIWVTEYNVFDVKKHIINSKWVHALYTINMTLGMLNNQNIEMEIYHSLVGNPSFRAVFMGNNDLEKLGSKSQTKPYELSAAGLGMKIILDAVKDKSEAVKIEFEGVTKETFMGKSFESMNGWVLKGEGKDKAIILNLSANEFEIDIADLNIEEGSSYASYNTENPIAIVSSIDQIKKKSATIVKNKAVIPSYSVVVF
jgi:hypothetical protein